MENSGYSEFSNSSNQRYSMTFWRTFLLTIFGPAGLISMVADGPRLITYSSLIIVIGVLLSIIKSINKNKS